MKTIVVQRGQTWLDIAAQYTGVAERAVEIALLNGYDDVTADLVAGQSLSVPTDLTAQQKKIANLFNTKNAPASGIGLDKYKDEQTIALEHHYVDEWTLYFTVGLPASHL